MTEAKYELRYWPIPFRGCFISYLFAYRDVALLEVGDFEQNRQMLNLPPSEQTVPVMGWPVLTERESGHALSQMPAMVLYVSPELDLMPEKPYDVALAMKVLMDCNDLLMELCRYNGSSMWDYEEWQSFRTQRLVRWMQIFEESLSRSYIAKEKVSFADVGVYALFGNMIRCLPQLEADLLKHAPGVHAHCRKIGAQGSLAAYVAEQEQTYGTLYCGGQIEQSIRDMLSQDETDGSK